MVEEQSPTFQMIFRILQLPEEVKAGPKAYRSVYWTMAFHVFFGVELFFSMLLTLMVGPNLISQDLRYNAIPLYFSRPVRRFDYFFGKLGVIATFIAAVSIAPAVAAYLLGVAFSFDTNVVGDTGRILLASIGYGAVVCVSAGTLMLAISSLSRNSRMVGAFWVGLWVIGPVAGQILSEVGPPRLVPARPRSRPTCSRLREAMLDTPAARSKLFDLLDVGRLQAQKAGMLRSLIRPGRLQAARPVPYIPPPSAGADDAGLR